MPADHRPDRPQAHFTAFLAGIGYHESAWRLADPADPAGPARFGVLERAAQAAERGLLDAVYSVRCRAAAGSAHCDRARLRPRPALTAAGSAVRE
jgi:hypothetical protein